MIFDKFARLKYKYGNRHVWCKGYYVSTVTYFYGHFFKERNGINFNKIVDIAVLYDILPVSDKLEL